jgi:hypothetical protein
LYSSAKEKYGIN